MSINVKICGITRLADARYCAGAGVDYLGFIQYPKSPRYLAPERAKEIIDWVHGPETVGVFVDASPDAVNAAVAAAGFTRAQLHGEESPGDCAAVTVPVIKAFAVGPDDTPETLRARMLPFARHVEAFLLDTRHPARGGSGLTFDWTVAAALSAEFPLFLAGGLHAGNVAEAVRAVHPLGVDVSSGVEESPGVKDIDKMADFFDALRLLPTAS